MKVVTESDSNYIIPTQVLESSAARAPLTMKMKLLPGKALKMRARREQHELGQRQRSVCQSGNVVQCQCGFNREEIPMVHLLCYIIHCHMLTSSWTGTVRLL